MTMVATFCFVFYKPKILEAGKECIFAKIFTSAAENEILKRIVFDAYCMKSKV